MKGFRTIIFNGAAAAIPLIDVIANHGDMLAPFLGPNGALVLSVFGLANCVLRWVTNSPIFQPE